MYPLSVAAYQGTPKVNGLKQLFIIFHDSVNQLSSFLKPNSNGGLDGGWVRELWLVSAPCGFSSSCALDWAPAHRGRNQEASPNAPEFKSLLMSFWLWFTEVPLN